MKNPRTIRLLVVEDSPVYMYLIQKAFQTRQTMGNWELTTATDGAQAVQLLFEEEKESAPLPDLIILDWNLPRVSGAEVLHRLKQHKDLRRIPVLVFSASKMQSDIHAAYDDYANGYVLKPGGDDPLTDIVETIEHFWVDVAHLPKAVRSSV